MAGFNLSLFDDVELSPVHEDEEGVCHRDPDEGVDVSFWTVYGHYKTGGSEALIDCVDEASCIRAAYILRVALQGRPVLSDEPF